ncbi:MAG TPA: MlaA family lipoprotein [Methylomirabilota bacterium]|nr:MlaA family lipoprotein [Methylomirabilota bacterium]
MRAILDMRQLVVIFGVLALALGGCSSLSGGLHSDSTLLASSAASGETAVSPTPAAEPTSAAIPAESKTAVDLPVKPDADQSPAPSLAFVPVSFEPIKPEDSPAVMVAFLEPLFSQRGTPAPPVDTAIEEYDPWEPFNEAMFKFNKYILDDYVLKPAAKAYNFVMPDMFQQMIDNGFSNIKFAQYFVNNLLQGRIIGASTELGRFLINSTLGIGGLFDIAKQEFNLQKTKADFGQTLGVWGAPPGPYLVLPFLPPLTVREGIGTAVDGAMDPLSYYIPFIWDRLGMKLGDTVNDRSLNLDLYQGFEETTVDLYSAVRNGYLQRRQKLIEDGKAGR